MVPYVITYNPSLPNIGEIINKYWGLLAPSQKSSVKYVFQHKPVLAFKRPRNLADILTHSTNLIQGLSLHVKYIDVPIVRVSMNQMSLFVLIQMKHFRLTVILSVIQKMLLI